jgi:uncharacterized protein (DUF1501 family)
MTSRFVLLILRGGMDGLSAVVPHGDPHLAALRKALVPDTLLRLDGFFGLHPALETLHGLYREQQALLVHAVAGPYRNRSHFEAQDLLEFGASQRQTSGWLNRAAGFLPARERATAIGIGGAIPVVLRGPAPVGSWMPLGWLTPGSAFQDRLLAMHAGDALTGPMLEAGVRDRAFTRDVLAAVPPARGGNATDLAERAGLLLADPDGPRIATLDIDGWDMHAAQVARMGWQLRDLDQTIAALRRGLGEAWDDTVALVVTEFGRTARANGSGGTDHGTASVAMLVGGAVAGGRMAGIWPGLGPGRLFEDRDLAPATDLRAILKAVLGQHMGLSAAQLGAVFPGSGGVAAMEGLFS